MALQIQQHVRCLEIITPTYTTEVDEDGITITFGYDVERRVWISQNIVQLGPCDEDTASVHGAQRATDQNHTRGRCDEDTASVHGNKKRWWIVGAISCIVVVVTIVLACVLTSNTQQTFSDRFIGKCLEYNKDNNESYCQHIFDVFEQAYIGKPKCNVSVGDYDDLMAEVTFDHPCNQTMLWTGTDELVHQYTAKDKDKKDCFTLEDTLLGYILNGQRWCGKEGSKETLTDGCPGLDGCANGAVRSFWDRASAKFAEYACEEVTVMLDGSEKIPFHPNSTFAKVEIIRLKHPRVTKLNVILVTGNEYVSNCTTDNLEIDLRKELHLNIGYSCNEVPESRITECSSSSSSTNVGCAACLLKPTE